ncbi:MAG TPA: glutathione transferase GstA [Spongiibacteraceae bacterium]|nr:glutathione transferase GstA [Spongiibacteraceae bacterium]
MKLFFSPAACSLSPHIVLRESGLPFELVRIDMVARKTADGADYLQLNPKGQVPALQLDDGQIITEGPVIVQYVADRAPEKKLVPAAGTIERYRVQEWLNFTCSEIHKNFGLIFKFAAIEDMKPALIGLINERIRYVEQQLEGKDFLVGNTFTVADAYMFTALSWCKFLQIDLSSLPSITAYNARIAARPAVIAAMQAEGLM